ncbi:MAG: acetoin utilization deacetylase AcuC-like enzyme/GNAT superfamily N-acetyltransferase [Alphaproteobacteria bacterium]|jgi:acetoin utilization deacetylase AcuC-like enzyme/GNAT superfamily N-acetyltransferase
MFRIRQVHDPATAQDHMAISQVVRMYQDAFSYYPQYAEKIAEMLKFRGEYDFEPVVLVAEGSKGRTLGFTLSFLFPELRLAYLDYIVSDPKRPSRGYGTALYEATEEFLLEKRYRGLLMDVPPDEEHLLKEKKRLGVNKRRMALYERLGARPIINTLYDTIPTKANAGYLTFLLYDDLETGRPLTAKLLRTFIPRLLAIKGNMKADAPKVEKIVASIKDDPVRLRAPRYLISRPQPGTLQSGRTIHLVSTGDAHQIHHLKERGYVERPARITFIRRGLLPFTVEEHKPQKFGRKHILAVHHKDLFRFISRSETEMKPGQHIYPNVFPIRRPDRIPKSWDMQAGYFCIDTFTPVTHNTYQAARGAVDAALTGAELVAKGADLVYALGRPPGHHAERGVFGGFCYFNNAAIAAHYLSRHGRVAFLDIDHHHGNGSQDIFYERDDVYFISIHGHPRSAYPYFAGYADERGAAKGKGFNRNFPLFPGADIAEYTETLTRALRLFARFKPDYLVVSLGFDIMSGDPTGSFNIKERGMRRIGAMLKETGWPTLVVQEGGYALRNLRTGATEFFRGLT